jgi:hypothetical protein
VLRSGDGTEGGCELSVRCRRAVKMSDDDVVTLYVKVHLHNILEIDDEGQQFMADVSVVRFRRVLRSCPACAVS